ncbi:MAG: hypothetical protein K0S14_1463 [Thermomicrobiales bacterium]|jgi:uncharacterized protein (DUF983 family)|nr:hypothetical protein [Thermomicrobiales bacterium]
MVSSDQAPRTDLWDLPRDTWHRSVVTMRRALGRRCPYCGSPGIYDGYFALREHCPRCGIHFEREEGYFLGAYALNLIVAEFLGLGLAILLIFKTDLRNLQLVWQEVIAVALAIAFPLALFPFSRTVWIAMDLIFHPPVGASERQLRGRLTERNDDYSE